MGTACSTQGIVRPPARVGLELVEPFRSAAVVEAAEARVEGLDAAGVVALAVVEADPSDATPSPEEVIAIDEYARAVLYNGLGHYGAARAAAGRATLRAGFALLPGALAELVEASVRSGHPARAGLALDRLEALAEATPSPWIAGVTAYAGALVGRTGRVEDGFGTAIAHLRRAGSLVALGRAHLAYGEWLRRQGRRVDARVELDHAIRLLGDAGLDGFAERARRELLATGRTVRRRVDGTRLDLTPQEQRIAALAAEGCTNPEIAEQLFLSPRTVEWHLRKVFTKLGVGSRRQLRAMFPPRPDGGPAWS